MIVSLNKLITQAKDSNVPIVLATDWHPPDRASFFVEFDTYK